MRTRKCDKKCPAFRVGRLFEGEEGSTLIEHACGFTHKPVQRGDTCHLPEPVCGPGCLFCIQHGGGWCDALDCSIEAGDACHDADRALEVTLEFLETGGRG
jgi:hypothetical protein